jgi:hypothetical protein
MRTIILSAANIIANTGNSQFLYRFPTSARINARQKLAVHSITMTYSTYNITAANGNNTYSYVWVDGLSYSVTIPDGYYTIDQINSYLQFAFINAGHYLIAPSGENVYFVVISANITTFTVEVVVFPCSSTLYPTTGASPYVIPSGTAPAWTPPVTAIVPLFVVPATNFRLIIGYAAGSYPAFQSYTTIQAFQSTSVPQMSPLTSFAFQCSLINNLYSVPNSLFYSFTPQVPFGTRMVITSSFPISVPIFEGVYSSFTLQITDQDFKPINIIDPNIVIVLAITGCESAETGMLV